MRRLLSLVLPLLLLAGSFQALAVARPSDRTRLAEPERATVYVPKTGAKSHRTGCQYLKKSCSPMALNEAREWFGACSVCIPPQ